MKVIAPEYQNKITLSTLLLELQFSMKLSQLETVLSCYQELFAFFFEYWFLLKNRENASQGEDFALKNDELTTPDPVRDGVNWLVYCAANPVGRWDPSGLTVLDDFAYQQRTNSQPGSEAYEESFKIEEEAARRNQGVSSEVVTDNKTPSLNVMKFTIAAMSSIPYYFTNKLGKVANYISEKREEALDWADENWPSWLTLTGSVRTDLEAIGPALMMCAPEMALAEQSLQNLLPLLESSGIGSQLLLGGNTVSTLGLSASNVMVLSSGTELSAPYPPNNGAFLNMTRKTFLMPGTKIDRFGSEYGKFLSPVGTPLDMRSLPPTADLSKYYIYSVVKPFEVTESIISPYYGKMGLGLQYESPVNVRTLLERGIIE